MAQFISDEALERLIKQNRSFSEFDGPNYPVSVERQKTIELGGRHYLLGVVEVERPDTGYVTATNSGRMGSNEQTGNIDGNTGQ